MLVTYPVDLLPLYSANGPLLSSHVLMLMPMFLCAPPLPLQHLMSACKVCGVVVL